MKQDAFPAPEPAAPGPAAQGTVEDAPVPRPRYISRMTPQAMRPPAPPIGCVM